jgi:hypothetical protein
MEQEAGEQQDSYYDPALGMTVTRSGKARWRRILAERDANRDNDATAAFVELLRQGPSAAA